MREGRTQGGQVMKYAVSVFRELEEATEVGRSVRKQRLELFIVDAVGREEALGKAILLTSNKTFPILYHCTREIEE